MKKIKKQKKKREKQKKKIKTQKKKRQPLKKNKRHGLLEIMALFQSSCYRLSKIVVSKVSLEEGLEWLNQCTCASFILTSNIMEAFMGSYPKEGPKSYLKIYTNFQIF